MAQRINLVPQGERARTVTNVGALALIVVSVLVVFALGLSYYLLSTSRSSLQEDLTSLEGERQRLEVQVAALASYQDLARQRSNLELVVQSVYAGRTLVSEFLSDLSLVLPENVWLANISLSAADPAGAFAAAGASGVEVAGTFSTDGFTYSFPDVALLLVRLQLVESLRSITLKQAGGAEGGSVDPTKKVRRFSIAGGIVNVQAPDEPLPVSKVEVEGL